jgi:hypothetical protein
MCIMHKNLSIYLSYNYINRWSFIDVLFSLNFCKSLELYFMHIYTLLAMNRFTQVHRRWPGDTTQRLNTLSADWPAIGTKRVGVQRHLILIIAVPSYLILHTVYNNQPLRECMTFTSSTDLSRHHDERRVIATAFYE